jgi:hypothetical protein
LPASEDVNENSGLGRTTEAPPVPKERGGPEVGAGSATCGKIKYSEPSPVCVRRSNWASFGFSNYFGKSCGEEWWCAMRHMPSRRLALDNAGEEVEAGQNYSIIIQHDGMCLADFVPIAAPLATEK